MSSSSKSAIGVLMEYPCLIRIASIFSKIQTRLYSPSGANPPLRIDKLGFGIILSISISLTSPSPLQLGQAP